MSTKYSEKVVDNSKVFINRIVRLPYQIKANNSNCGSRFERVYKEKSIDGKVTLVFDSTKNVYDIIQSYRDDNNIYKILNRMTQGDYSQLDKNQGNYFDLTSLPKNINDMNDYLLETEKRFNSADPKLKAVFDNNYKVMMNDFENGTFDLKFNKYLEENHPQILKRKAEREKMLNESITKVVDEKLKGANKDNA